MMMHSRSFFKGAVFLLAAFVPVFAEASAADCRSGTDCLIKGRDIYNALNPGKSDFVADEAVKDAKTVEQFSKARVYFMTACEQNVAAGCTYAGHLYVIGVANMVSYDRALE